MKYTLPGRGGSGQVGEGVGWIRKETKRSLAGRSLRGWGCSLGERTHGGDAPQGTEELS